MLVMAVHPRAGFAQRQRVNMWVRHSPESWDTVSAFSSGNLNLNLLTGYRLLREWKAEVQLITCVETEEEVDDAYRFLEELCDLSRLPSRVERRVVVGSFEEQLEAVPTADVNIIGLPRRPNPTLMRRWVEVSRSTCIFVRDSGGESALV
jgi:hypothetical protein